jgi:hypothetical protein
MGGENLELQELKTNYNKLVKRYHDALDFFEKTPSMIDTYWSDYETVFKDLHIIQKQIEKLLDRKMTDEEVMQGFKQ